ARYFLRNISTDQLLKMKRDKMVCIELVFRKGIRDEQRQLALADLSRIEKKAEVAVLVDAIRNQDEQSNQDESVAFDLVRVLTGRGAKELAKVRSDLEQMAVGAKTAVTRQLGYVALIAADDGVERAWTLGTRSVTSLQDLVGAMPLIRDPGHRAAMYPKVKPLLDGLPKELAKGSDKTRPTMGRYVRIELPGEQ